MPALSLTSRGPIMAAPWRRGAESGAPGECFVSHTVFRYDRWRDLPQIGLTAEKTARTWSGRPGSMWLLQWFHPGRRLIGDLSVWRNEDDLHAFLALPFHHELVAHWKDRMHGTHHGWIAESVDRDAIWARAKSLIGEGAG